MSNNPDLCTVCQSALTDEVCTTCKGRPLKFNLGLMVAITCPDCCDSGRAHAQVSKET